MIFAINKSPQQPSRVLGNFTVLLGAGLHSFVIFRFFAAFLDAAGLLRLFPGLFFLVFPAHRLRICGVLFILARLILRLLGRILFLIGLIFLRGSVLLLILCLLFGTVFGGILLRLVLFVLLIFSLILRFLGAGVVLLVILLILLLVLLLLAFQIIQIKPGIFMIRLQFQNFFIFFVPFLPFLRF